MPTIKSASHTVQFLNQPVCFVTFYGGICRLSSGVGEGQGAPHQCFGRDCRVRGRMDRKQKTRVEEVICYLRYVTEVRSYRGWREREGEGGKEWNYVRHNLVYYNFLFILHQLSF